MKKFILLALALVLILSLAGCGMSRSVTPEEIENIDFGIVTEKNYENAHFGLGYRFEKDWNSDSQQDIWARNEWNPEKDIREQMLKSLKKPNYFWEMHTETAAQDATLDVSIDNVSVLADPDLSQEKYAEYCAEQAVDHWNQIKASNISISMIEEEIAGQLSNGFLITCEYEGDTIYYRTLYLKKGIYAAEIRATCIGEDITDQILYNFYEVKNQPS